MTENNIAVKVDHVSKFFRLPTEATHSLRTAMVNRFKGIKGYKEQHVLKDISFEVNKGDFFGIVGRNGSGKSTLLKIISQIYVPEKGSVTIDGKLVSFIELGVGFNPELTGRENVYMNGAMLGFTTEEIDAMYDDIVEFAELEDFMNQKLKNYSSGMQVRLAFSVAIKAQGDVLILDEVLAVGDEAFQRKCNDYFMERKESGKTTILVTHDMGAVKKYCNRAVLIENGLVKAYGDPEDVANQYSLDNTTVQVKPKETVKEEKSDSDVEEVVEEPTVLVDNLQVKLLSPTQVTQDDLVEFEISYDVLEDIEAHPVFSMTDIDRNIWIYNDNAYDYPTKTKGHKVLKYSCSLESVNNIKLKLQVTILGKSREMLAFANSENAPIIMVTRSDIARDDFSAVDSAAGLIRRNGSWVITEE
ncbi:ABC transporter ATP-binding protein [Streptococcus loxodontisalivarius]|uniref:ABC-2 type transport system ATP-binding protein n=1 Tax=Streptococcus loxodontisalivarius TaxID=1349415 RepID=A0ABS2PRB7_9STRE|nr:ABC transporter ATP-binding protein [Streptococcus loxodontisalivarius]MBM7642426.1 ABC-2 type transport system ATP-binding protein [Streptococcus loxodontisalivarius]